MNTTTQPAEKKSSGLLGNLLFNIALPVIILSKFSTEDYLGPVWGLVIALAFPVGFGLWELLKSGKVNFFSVVGIISVLLTGGMSLLQLDPKYIAIKEAAVPGIIGLLVWFSQHSKFHLIKTLLENAQLLNMEKLHQVLESKQLVPQYEHKLNVTNQMLAGSFFLSSVLNYLLAKWILVSPPGTPAYNEELGTMTALSYPVIALPSMVLNQRHADITATDYHPEVEAFLNYNTALNEAPDIPFYRADWKDLDSGMGKFDLLVGSDILYEQNHVGLLSGFIDRHAKADSEVILVDPDRRQHARFSKTMVGLGFSHHQRRPAPADYLDASFKGQILHYARGSLHKG